MNRLHNPEKYEHIVSINVDIQNDFCPGGALGVAGGNEVVAPMNTINQYVRDMNGTVVFTRDWHPLETSHFVTQGGPWPPHCIAYHAGAAFHDELIVDTRGGDIVASKGTQPDIDDYSGLMAVLDNYREMDRGGYNDVRLSEFVGTMQLRRGRLAIVVGGLATDYCVKATVLDLLSIRERSDLYRSMGVYLVEDAIRAVDVHEGDGQRAIDEMIAAGAELVTANDIIDGEVLEVAR